jgi:5-methylcytosine-specific restriction endonuclease McrA
MNKWGRKSYYKHRQKNIQRSLKWNRLNNERFKINLKRNRKENASWYRKYGKEYRRKHKERYKVHYAKSLAKRRGLLRGGSVKPCEWYILKVMFENRCVYCNKKPRILTMDHRIPISRGGKHEANNIVPACRSCNSKKHTKTFEEFYHVGN